MSDKIETLTEEQEALMGKVAQEYEDIVLSGNDSHNMVIIKEGIAFIYGVADLKPPEIVVCSSPWDMAKQADIEKGSTFDNIGCGFDSGWTAFYDYMGQIGVEYDKEWGFDTWKKFIKESGVFACILYENIAFVCIRPCSVKRNLAGDLHCENGPAIAWKDGYCEYYLNGVAVSKSLVMTPAEKLDANLVIKESNAEIRREIVRKIGVELVCQRLGAKIIDAEGDYELINLSFDDRYRPYLKMKNPSIFTYHIEGVDPSCKTVKDALKWRNGTDEVPEVLT
jgi:hypothetical protein